MIIKNDKNGIQNQDSFKNIIFNSEYECFTLKRFNNLNYTGYGRSCLSQTLTYPATRDPHSISIHTNARSQGSDVY